MNSGLGILVSFLNETAGDITAYRVLVLETMQGLYMQRVTGWDCDFRSYFLTKPFATDRSAPIGQENYSDVLEYVDERVLSELCLSRSDFEGYLKAEYIQGGLLTTNQLMKGVAAYTSNAIDYYFPDDNDTGLTSLDWSEAGYKCENLPPDQMFRIS